MTSTITCPDKNTIDDLLANRLPSDQAEQVRSHLAQCATCRQKLSDTGGNKSVGNTVVQEAKNPASTIAHTLLSPARGPGELGWLGEYRVLGVLGEGGMAIVYDAEDPKLGRMVALKVLKPEITTASTRERFLGEARVVASLSSEHVVDIYAVGEANDTPFMAMEKLIGETLAQRLDRDRWLPVADALAIVREAAEGLVDLHARGLIHRDLKPDNLWLESHSDGHTEVKLIDFGIARQSTSDPGLTTPGHVIGTPTYMAPEQASGGQVDPRADLYSLGCVLYRMLAGKTPFDSVPQNTLAVLSAVIRGEIVPITQVAPSLSPAVAALIQQLLEHDREKRPASAGELVRRLRELEQEERAGGSKTKIVQGVQGLTADPNRRTQRKAQPLSVALGALAIVAALSVGGFVMVRKIFPQWFAPVPTPIASAEKIKVGLLFSESDATALSEMPILDVVEFAIEEINEKGGVMGRLIEPIVADGASNPTVFASKAAKLIDEDKVEVIFGCWSSPSRKRVAAICDDPQHDRLLFYPGNSEGLEEYQNVVYLGGAPNQILVPLIRYAYADLRRRKVFVIGCETVYSRVMDELIDYEVQQLGATLVGTRKVPRGEADFKSIAEEIKSSGADFVVSTLFGADNQLLFRAMRNAGLSPPQVATAWLTLTETNLAYFAPTLAGDYSAGCYFENKETSADSFENRCRQHFGQSERISDSMEAAYYGVYLWKAAVEKAKSTKTADVREALRGMEINTADGPIKIDPVSLHAWQIGQVSKVVNKDGRLTFQAEHRTPGPIEPQLYPAWRPREDWNDFRDKLYQEWDQNWESIR